MKVSLFSGYKTLGVHPETDNPPEGGLSAAQMASSNDRIIAARYGPGVPGPSKTSQVIKSEAS